MSKQNTLRGGRGGRQRRRSDEHAGANLVIWASKRIHAPGAVHFTFVNPLERFSFACQRAINSALVWQLTSCTLIDHRPWTTT